jgi:hypothetical protein
MSRYTLKIGGSYAGDYPTIKACREHAKNNGGYRYGWSVWDNARRCEVLNKGESAIHYTARIHDEWNDIQIKITRIFFFIALILFVLVLIGR